MDLKEKERITKGNKLIAEFMGLKTKLHPSYHESWNWLMLVVQKIFEMDYDVNINYRSTLIHHMDDNIIINSDYGYGHEKSIIDHTYRAIVDFIIFYNSKNHG